MTITISEVRGPAIEAVVPLLLLAEPWEPALRWSLEHLSDAVYRAEDADGALVGAATLHWRADPCEIEELAVSPDRQGHGIGQQIVAWLLDEAQRRGKTALLVGTPNASIGNIAFYQKCGFRMHQIRPNFFRYYRTPRYENGIQIRDMIVFRRELGAREGD